MGDIFDRYLALNGQRVAAAIHLYGVTTGDDVTAEIIDRMIYDALDEGFKVLESRAIQIKEVEQ